MVLLPHGNAKRASTVYCRTQKSMLFRIKEVSGKPKDVVSQIHEEAGGVLEATSVSGLPRDHRQAYNNQQSTSKRTSGVDPLFELVQQCKIDLQPGGRKFIRSVTFETGTCCILASDSQLENVVRFCTNKGDSCVLGVDPTFDLGKFYVTVTTFMYSHVICTVVVSNLLHSSIFTSLQFRVYTISIGSASHSRGEF